ncbi:MAG: hypothetical protein DMF24_03005 [Verrucomicrobia bacterium]|nr:MAG: hypothetical protein DME90_10310 [Verrucomicrobiota bacterium]PYL62723.1 MAG: hypothetical protein DMF24_03005 [Verrucomicrobiota bacterium]
MRLRESTANEGAVGTQNAIQMAKTERFAGVVSAREPGIKERNIYANKVYQIHHLFAWDKLLCQLRGCR